MKRPQRPHGSPTPTLTPGNFLFWFENDDLSISLLVAEPEVQEGPFDNLWAAIEPISRSTETATWELAERCIAA